MPSIPTDFFEKSLELTENIMKEREALLELQSGQEGDEVDVDHQKDLIDQKAQILAVSTMHLVQTTNRFSSAFDEEEQPLGLMYLSYTASLVSNKSVKFVQSYRAFMENTLDYLAREELEEHQRELQELIIHYRAACEILKQGADCNATQKFRDVLAKAEEIVVLTDLLIDSALTVDSSQLLRYNKSFSAEIHRLIDLIHAVTSTSSQDEATLDATVLMTEELLPQLLSSIIVSAKNISCAKRGAFRFNHAAQVRSRTLVDMFELTLQLQKIVFGYDLSDPNGPHLKLAYRPPRPTRTETRDGVVRSKVFEELKSTRRVSATPESSKKDSQNALKAFAESQKKARKMQRSTSEKAVAGEDVQAKDEEDGNNSTGRAKGKSLFSGKGESLRRKSKKTAQDTLSRTADIKQLFSKRKKSTPASDSPQKGGTEQRLHLDSSSPSLERRRQGSKSTVEALSLDDKQQSSSASVQDPPDDLAGAKNIIGDLSLSLGEAAAAKDALRALGPSSPSKKPSKKPTTNLISPRPQSLVSPQSPPLNAPTKLSSSDATIPEVRLTTADEGSASGEVKRKSPRKQAEEVAMEELETYAKAALQVMKRLRCFSDGWEKDEENLATLHKEMVKSFKLSSRRATLLNVRKHQSTSRMMRLAVSTADSINRPEPAFQVASSWKKISSSTANLLKDVDLPTLKAETGPLVEKTKLFVTRCLEHVTNDDDDEEAPVKLGNAATDVLSLLLKITSICGKREAADFLAVPVSQLLSTSRTIPQRDEEYIRSVSSEESHVIHLLCKTYLESLHQRAQSLCSLIAQMVSAVTSIPVGSTSMPQSLFMQVIAVTWSLKEEVEALLDHSETARFLHNKFVGQEIDDREEGTAVAWARVKGRSVGSRGNLHVIAASKNNIWEALEEDSQEPTETDSSDTDNREVTSGSVNRLVRTLCDPSCSEEYMAAFFRTCPTFASLELVVRKMQQLYDVPEEHLEKKAGIVSGIVRATRALISMCQLDLTAKLVKELEKLFKAIKSDDESAAQELRQHLQEGLAARQCMLAVPGPTLETHLEGDVSRFPPPAEVFMKTAVEVLASHITRVDFSLFREIQAREFFDLAWSKAQLRHRAPNIMAMIKRVNRISYWVPNVILWHSSMSDRGKVVEKFIQLAEELRKLRNYSALMGVLGGLGMSSTARLKFTFLAVNEQKLALLRELQTLMSSNKSFAAYRTQLSTCKAPAVPYLGVYLSDLTFINDGNSDLIGDDKAINFKKRKMVYRVLRAIEGFQMGSIEAPDNECAELYTLSLPQLTDDDLYQLSLKREPRGAEITDILAL